MGLKRFFFKQFFWVFLPQKKVKNPGISMVTSQYVIGLEIWV
jgi:hypothetical protein